ncbi:2-amino-4-hydroxy-6-hydroxymethyldihydropteridine diphosphokinase [uncultured Paraglaciecola sp.]|uniref:2-amino-4-hydroxy-6- hydroxymethyldihydropteridine diphosphokinase n=1 Tax=uncultured Paraglaciecola sp. TaxID=1765024 RepID=UPI0025966807|nr:2-amino-4-hydroxy-6-hydroxymethyldihydropteridine diphosphokinase [uncultured Paraglaciecola sp.]
MTQVYIGLGSNLAEPLQQLQSAISALGTLPDSSLVCVSSFYGSQPMGPQDQPDYVNSVALIETQLLPEVLLDHTQAIENEQGRQRTGERWGPRTLDLDILLYGQQVISTKTLTVPHYGMQQREFVLYPLYEITPDLVLPDGKILSELVSRTPKNGLQQILLNTDP